MKDIQCGVTQGSFLGPLLFLLYINDLINCSSNKPILFADDTYLTVKNKSIENVKLKINNEIKMFTQSVNTNKFTHINISKSNVVIFPPYSKQYEAKYLRAITDRDLNCSGHIKQLENKLAKSVEILRKMKLFLTTSSLLQLYYAIFQSHF